MYLMIFNLKPTAGLTFRILPGSIIDIATYPFVPPTTLSGFLRRLAMMSAGGEFPNTGPNDDETPFYALPRELIALGAYPSGACTKPAHRTFRKGPRDLGHSAFSAILRGKAKGPENIQLHTWEYLITEELIGYVVSQNGEELNRLAGLVGYGAKLGKEGFAFVAGVSGPHQVERAMTQAIPSTVVPADGLFDTNPNAVADIFSLYSFAWKNLGAGNPSPSIKRKRKKASRQEQEYEYSSNAFDQHRSPITGYQPFPAALLGYGNSSKITLDFWHNKEVFIPAMLLGVLQREVSDET